MDNLNITYRSYDEWLLCRSYIHIWTANGRSFNNNNSFLLVHIKRGQQISQYQVVDDILNTFKNLNIQLSHLDTGCYVHIFMINSDDDLALAKLALPQTTRFK